MYFYDKQIQMTLKALKDNMKKVTEIYPVSMSACDYKSGSELPNVTDEWVKSENGCTLTGLDKHYWLHTTVKTPACEEGKQPALNIATNKTGWDATNPQCMVYIDGELVCGMDVNHTEYFLEFDREYDVYIYYYTGTNTDHTTKIDVTVQTVIYDLPVKELFYDIEVPYNVMLLCDENGEDYAEIVKHLGVAVNMIDLCNIGSKSYYESINNALTYMKEEFYKKVCNSDSSPLVSGIGHTHIDVAWLWTYAQTKEKVQRSFSTVLALMENYPEYKFMSSQPQLYKYLKEEAPQVYEKVKEKVKEGRWEVEGGMWVEADCNLMSGESMVRQFMHGKKFIKDEFGVESKILWLPDVFGYSAAMPQILKKCGIDKFVTSKISWNETNKMPCDTFYWQGIDGTEIFSYFLTAQNYDKNPFQLNNRTTYNAMLEPKDVKGTWNRYQQKAFNSEVISTFGYGDGGGGPTIRMLENQKRMAYGIPGLPRTQIDFAGNILERIKNNFDENCKTIKHTPKWSGELYLEFHRGTYTNMAENKKYNRKSELLYQTAEAMSAFDMILTGGSYDSEKINNNWEAILLNQFHDVIPGSSIKEVYEDTRKMYAEIISDGEDIVNNKLSSIASKISADGGIIVFNPTGFTVSDVVEHKGKKYFCKDVPAYGWKHISENEAGKKVTVNGNTLENEYYTVTLDENANISSIYDKRSNREVLSGLGNRIELYEDRPYRYDGWELSLYHKHKCSYIDELSEITAFSDEVSAGFIVKREFSNSTITQKIVLYSEKDRIDFETEVDWHENNMVLKTAFPVDVFANNVTYDIQFGNVQRPVHENTSWEQAKFEVCAHKWADISDYNHGVSILNDCKYGHSAEGNTMRLTLLKSANYPNPESDRGINTFKYSLLPHSGDFRQGGTVKEAYIFNNPLRYVEAGGNGEIPKNYSMVSCVNENIVIDTVKKAENNDDIIVRAYDAYNCTDTVEFKFGFDVKEAYVCDMLENNEYKLSVNDNAVSLKIKNFEVVTLRLVR